MLNMSSNSELNSFFKPISELFEKQQEKIKSLEAENKLLKNKIKEIENEKFFKNNIDFSEFSQDNNSVTNSKKNVNQNYKKYDEVLEMINPVSKQMSKKDTPNFEPSNKYSHNSKLLEADNIINNYHTEKENKNKSQAEDSKSDIKNFLSEVKQKIPYPQFKEFIQYIKILTDKNQAVNRKEIFENVKNIFGNNLKDLYVRFEQLLTVNKK